MIYFGLTKREVTNLKAINKVIDLLRETRNTTEYFDEMNNEVETTIDTLCDLYEKIENQL